MKTFDNLPDALKECLSGINTSEAELARLVGIHKQYLSDLKRGVKNLAPPETATEKTLRLIAEACGFDLEIEKSYTLVPLKKRKSA